MIGLFPLFLFFRCMTNCVLIFRSCCCSGAFFPKAIMLRTHHMCKGCPLLLFKVYLKCSEILDAIKKFPCILWSLSWGTVRYQENNVSRETRTIARDEPPHQEAGRGPDGLVPRCSSPGEMVRPGDADSRSSKFWLWSAPPVAPLLVWPWNPFDSSL